MIDLKKYLGTKRASAKKSNSTLMLLKIWVCCFLLNSSALADPYKLLDVQTF